MTPGLDLDLVSNLVSNTLLYFYFHLINLWKNRPIRAEPKFSSFCTIPLYNANILCFLSCVYGNIVVYVTSFFPVNMGRLACAKPGANACSKILPSLAAPF